MRLPRNPNYVATIVALRTFVDLPNCDNVKSAIIFGSSVIVAKDVKAGDVGLFFPPETQLSTEFIANNNLFRKHEYGNLDPSKAGFFEQQGRVKTMKFRGHKSEGFWIPFSSLNYLVHKVGIDDLSFLDVEGTSFDFVGEHEICRKYIPKSLKHIDTKNKSKGKVARLEDSIVDGQFRFHFDTENLRRNVHKVMSTDLISISDKWHGTSAVYSKVLVKRKLGLFERILDKLGVSIQKSVYGLTYSSRRVIKAVNGEAKGNNNHFYSEDIWGVVAREVEHKIPNGFTVYGEIVGFTPNGEAIQEGYSYRCAKGEHKFVVYRATQTSLDGLVTELGWTQLEEFCAKYGFDLVPFLYVGHANVVFDELDPDDASWSEKFLALLESRYVHDQDCFYNPGLPAEGIVLRIDRLHEAESYKLKNFRFLKRESDELDKGVLDTETAQTEEQEEVLA